MASWRLKERVELLFLRLNYNFYQSQYEDAIFRTADQEYLDSHRKRLKETEEEIKRKIKNGT